MRPSEERRLESLLTEVGEQYAEARAREQEVRRRLETILVKAVKGGFTAYRATTIAGVAPNVAVRAVARADKQSKKTENTTKNDPHKETH